jgi:uncharacterized protein
LVVVSDSSVITGLLAINKLYLLQNLFHNVLLTPTVYSELSTLEKYNYPIEDINTPWINVKGIKDYKKLQSLKLELDLGEAESIVLALEEKADYLLVDEKKGRDIAKKEGLKIIGLLGILVQAKTVGLIPLLKPEIEILTSKIEFRLHQKLIQAALDAVGE